MSSDTTVDWGRDFENDWGEGDNRYFRKFWRNVVRWLAENSESGQNRLRVETDKIIYRPGQEIQITAQAVRRKAQRDGELPAGRAASQRSTNPILVRLTRRPFR